MKDGLQDESQQQKPGYSKKQVTAELAKYHGKNQGLYLCIKCGTEHCSSFKLLLFTLLN